MSRHSSPADLEVIAEAGSNHDGSVERALRLIDIAVAAGASSVKFQFIFPDGLYLPFFRKDTQIYPNPAYARRKAEQLTTQQWEEVWRHGQRVGIALSASVFCERGVELLARLGSDYVKIASTDLTNLDLVDLAATRFERVLVSTGMATLEEVSRTVSMVQSRHPRVLMELMHCVSAYPCPLEDANPARIKLLRDVFGVRVGYSDHTEGSLSAILALSQGAVVFEKHFTDDRARPGFDHANAMEPEQLRNYIDLLRSAETALNGIANRNAPQEKQTRIRARRGVYAARDMAAGHVLTQADLLHVRPSTTHSALPSQLIGRPLAADVQRYDALGDCHGVGPVASRWLEASDYWAAEMSEKGMIQPAAGHDVLE